MQTIYYIIVVVFLFISIISILNLKKSLQIYSLSLSVHIGGLR